MQREIITTEDGSHTLYVPALDEHYHSTHGAIQESQHVYLQAGLASRPETELAVFEVGFGTGLNCLLSYKWALQQGRSLYYCSIEKYPLTAYEASLLNYPARIDPTLAPVFEQLHRCRWGELVDIHPRFVLHKLAADLLKVRPSRQFQVVFYDAFAPSKQAELWTPEVFLHLSEYVVQGGVLVTYSAKGDVRRALQQAGFRVERLPGPPGKAQMLRATKCE